MAKASVQLAALGPHLAELAGKLETQVDRQASHAAEVAESMRQLSERLHQAVTRLEGASGSIHSVMGDIARIADQTRIISINASIEAARAGEMGRAFNVVAIEVQQLAAQTRSSTHAIEERVAAMQNSVDSLSASVAAQPAATGAAGVTLRTVNEQIQAMAGTTDRQRAGASALRSLGTQANQLTENLLFAVGSFRLQAHRRAVEEMTGLRTQLEPLAGQWPGMERALLAWLAERPEFELAYVTDSRGRQMTENIGWRQNTPAKLPGARDKDWGDRPWFRQARAQAGEVAVSDIYRSAATGSFCFTISAALTDATGAVVGVIGADVNFQRLVADAAG